MHKIKVFVSNIVWRICKLGPNVGNKVMDILGRERYEYIQANHTN